MRKLVAISGLAAILVFVAIGIVVTYVSKLPDTIEHPETGFMMPNVDDIDDIFVVGIEDAGGVARKPFKIPHHRWADFLSTLSPSERDDNATAMSAVAIVQIVKADGSEVMIHLYEKDRNLWFSVGKKPIFSPYYHGGSLSRLKQALDVAYRESVAE